MSFSNRVYDVLKWVCIIAIPACIACFTAIGNVCGLASDIITVVDGCMGAVATFIGALIGISCANYDSKEV